MVIVNAGSSAGTEDYTVHVLRELGEVIVHGVAVKPGKPVILAIVRGKPVIGLPGYPVSAYIGFENFVEPLLKLWGRRSEVERDGRCTYFQASRVQSEAQGVRQSKGRQSQRQIRCSSVGPRRWRCDVAGQCRRFCVIEQNSEGVEAGEKVEIELYRSKHEVENTVVIIGSHDLILDIIADMMPEKHTTCSCRALMWAAWED